MNACLEQIEVGLTEKTLYSTLMFTPDCSFTVAMPETVRCCIILLNKSAFRSVAISTSSESDIISSSNEAFLVGNSISFSSSVGLSASPPSASSLSLLPDILHWSPESLYWSSESVQARMMGVSKIWPNLKNYQFVSWVSQIWFTGTVQL